MRQHHRGRMFFLAMLGLLLGWILAVLAPAAQAQVRLESPAPGSFRESGVGLIRGWVCKANRVEVSIDDGPLLATAYGTDRPDTATACGDTNNGFGLTYNWNRLGDGVHTLKAFADGSEFASVNFAVTTLGGEFLAGLQGDYAVPDFPARGAAAPVRWSEPHQNFVIVRPIAIPPVADPPARSGARLESPAQGSSESGVGLIRGWACAAARVEVSIDGGPLLATGYGTDRPDTATACGDTNNGFGLTYNWNRLGDGVHTLKAFADGVAFADVNFAVATLGSDFLPGLLAKVRLLGFPRTGPATTAPQASSETGPTTTLQWSEPDQNFLIATTTATGEKIAVVSAITDILNKFAVLGVGTGQAESSGMYVEKDAAGAPTQLDGLTWTHPDAGRWTDLRLNAEGLPATYRDSSGIAARLSQFTPSSVVVEFVDANGTPLGGSVTAPLDFSLLQNLQALADRIRAATPSAAPARLPEASVPDGFSLQPLLVELFATGAAAEGEVLCALQAAATTAGVRALVAPLACQSQLLQKLRALLAASRGPQTAAMAGDLDPAIQQVLQFERDVPQAPCAATDTSAACLAPATAALQERLAEPVPDSPPPYLSRLSSA